MSGIIAAEACPSIRCAAFTSAAALTAGLAAVCLRSWIVIPGNVGLHGFVDRALLGAAEAVEFFSRTTGIEVCRRCDARPPVRATEESGLR